MLASSPFLCASTDHLVASTLHINTSSKTDGWQGLTSLSLVKDGTEHIAPASCTQRSLPNTMLMLLSRNVDLFALFVLAHQSTSCELVFILILVHNLMDAIGLAWNSSTM